MTKPSICILVWSLFVLPPTPVAHAVQAPPPHLTTGVATAKENLEGKGAGRVVQDMEGVDHDLVTAGKAVALVFWQTWCRSCEREAPEIAAAARANADEVAFYGVIPGPNGFVDDNQVARTARKWGYTFPQVRDRDLQLTKDFHVSGTPTIIVLDPEGNIIFRGRRPPKNWTVATRPPAR